MAALYAAARSEEARANAFVLVATPRGQIASAVLLVLLTWAVLTRRIYVVSLVSRAEAEKKREAQRNRPADASNTSQLSRRSSWRREDNKSAEDQCPPKRQTSMKDSRELHIAAGDPVYDEDPTVFKVRGESYLMDKLKVTCGMPVFRLMDCDLLELDAPTNHVARFLDQRLEGLKAKHPEYVDPYVLVIQLMVPGPPFKTFCMYFVTERKRVFDDDTPFSTVARRFFAPVHSPDGSDGGTSGYQTNAALHKFRNNTFKLIPRCVNGPFVVKRAVGEVPTLLGNKLQQLYYGPAHGRYFELVINISSSRIAQYTLGLAINYASVVVADMALVMQGTMVDELPEVLMGLCRIEHINMRDAAKLEVPPTS